MHPLDARTDRKEYAQDEQGLGLLQHHQVLHRGLPRAHQDHRQRDHPDEGARRRPAGTTRWSGSAARSSATGPGGARRAQPRRRAQLRRAAALRAGSKAERQRSPDPCGPAAGPALTASRRGDRAPSAVPRRRRLAVRRRRDLPAAAAAAQWPTEPPTVRTAVSSPAASSPDRRARPRPVTRGAASSCSHRGQYGRAAGNRRTCPGPSGGPATALPVLAAPRQGGRADRRAPVTIDPSRAPLAAPAHRADRAPPSPARRALRPHSALAPRCRLPGLDLPPGNSRRQHDRAAAMVPPDHDRCPSRIAAATWSFRGGQTHEVTVVPDQSGIDAPLSGSRKSEVDIDTAVTGRLRHR